MNLRESASRFVEGNQLLREATNFGQNLASLAGVDNDEHLWRSLTETNRDLGSITDERQRALAAFLTDTNPFARRILGIMRDFICGEGWSINADNEKVQALLDAHWKDPVNAWPIRLYSRVHELGMFGEQCYTAETGEDQIVRLAYVDPSAIGAVKPMDENMEVVDEIRLKAKNPASGKDRKLKAIRYDYTKRRLVGTDGDHGDDKEYVGQCFFWALNKPIRATRGRSDLLTMSDSIEMNDKFLWNRSDRAALINSYVWDVLLKDASEDEIRTFLKQNKTPKPGSIRAHNEGVEWNAVSPNLGASDGAEEARMMRTPLLVGSGYPEHWLVGVGDNANKASAYEMADPPIKMMRTRQIFVQHMIITILRFQIDEAVRLKNKIIAGVPPDELYAYTLNVAELSRRDQTANSTALKTVSESLALAVQQNFCSEKTARDLWAFVVSSLGQEVDPAVEQERIETEEAERDAQRVANAPSLDDIRREIAAEGEEEEGELENA